MPPFIARSWLPWAACDVLLLDQGEDEDNSPDIVNALMTIFRHDTATKESNPATLRKRFLDVMEMIERVVNSRNMDHSLRNIDQVNENEFSENDCVSCYGDVIPPAFFERNEAIWRGRVKPNAMEQHAHSVPKAAKRLAEVVAKDFWGVDDDGISHENDLDIVSLSEAKESKSPVVQDILNNLLSIKSIPLWAKQKKEQVS